MSCQQGARFASGRFSPFGMPVTVGATSPLAGPSQAKVQAARKKAGAAARLSAVLSGALAAVSGGSNAPCRAEATREFGRKADHSTISSCDSDGVHVPPGVYKERHPCLTAEYERAEEALATGPPRLHHQRHT